ncbi:hypothetical protein D3C87_637390 [compost metagenome]
MSYTGYEISKEDRAKLARVFPPKFSDFIGHHVTWQFGAHADSPLPPDGTLRVVGYASDKSLECLVVEMDGSIRRPDRATLHITWSLDRAEGRKPVDSNELLRGGYQAIRPINISAAPKFFK